MSQELQRKKLQKWIIVGAIVVVVAVIVYGRTRSLAPGALDPFAQCLKDKKAVFYGAFWCPHCQAQKKLFGNSARLLPYVECSTPDGQGENGICAGKHIQGYPTWEFSDGTREEREMSLDELAEKTGCTMPK